MEWEQFLEHPKVISFNSRVKPGKYLLGIVLHDSLQAITNYQASVQLAQEKNAPQEAHDWYEWVIRWKKSVDVWLNKLNEFGNRYYREQELPNEPNWQAIISDVGEVVCNASTMLADGEAITNATQDQTLSDAIELALDNIRDLNTICSDIQEQAYLRLWERAVQ